MAKGIMEKLLQTGAEATLMKKLFKDYKRCKTDEQKQAIEFFESRYLGKGCCCLSFTGKHIAIQEYIAMVNNKCNKMNLKQRALNKLGLEEAQVKEAEPFCIYGFNFEGVGDAFAKSDNNFLVIENGIAVTAKYDVSWIFCDAKQIYTYTITFNMTSDDMVETTHEFFYEDVTCFEMMRDVSEDIKETAGCGCGCLKTKDKVTKSLYISNSLKITVPDSRFYASMEYNPEVVKSINAMKNLVRERKNRN